MGPKKRATRAIATGFALAAALLGLSPTSATADVTLDGTFAHPRNVYDPESGTYVIYDTDGKLNASGNNLFYSFDEFSIGVDETAKFTSTESNVLSSVDNILGRVTGTYRSDIHGTIDAKNYDHANLYLMNPNGIVFGQGASLNLNGSFYATTADYIRFGEDEVFDKYTNKEEISSFSTAAPSAFGFLDVAAEISVQETELKVPSGKILSLVGGDIEIRDGTLKALGGRINIASVRSKGEVFLVPDGSIEVEMNDFADMGLITLLASSYLDVGNGTEANASGAVVVRGGDFTLEQSSISAVNEDASEENAPVAVDIHVQRDMRMTGTPDTDAEISSDTDGDGGDAGDVVIQARKVELNNAQIRTVTGADADAGDIMLKVDSLLLENGAGIAANTKGSGKGGTVTIIAKDAITISGGSFVASATNSSGDAGHIVITTSSLDMEDNGLIQATSAFTGDAGRIELEVDQLTMSGGALVINSTRFTGEGGTVIIRATDTINITGRSLDQTSGIRSKTSGSETGGNIEVTARVIELGQGAIISSESLNNRFGDTGDAGNIHLDATDLVIEGGAEVTAKTKADGEGGNIRVDAQNITLSNGGAITAASEGETSNAGKAGSVSIIAGDTFELANKGRVSVETVQGDAGGIDVTAADVFVGSGAEITARTTGAGQGGSITVNAENSTLIDGGTITAASEGEATNAGRAGSVSITTGDSFELANRGRVSVETVQGNAGNILVETADVLVGSGTEITARTKGVGQGGSITVNAENSTLIDGGAITAASESPAQGAGESGSIFIRASDTFQLANGGEVSVETAEADAGSIQIEVGELLHLLNNGRITTSVADGEGDGGDINIDPIFVVLQNGSAIVAQAQKGRGGNIKIVTDYLFKSSDSIIDASSAQGIDGTVVITSPDADVISGTLPLSEAFLDAAALLGSHCAARTSPLGSSLVMSSRGGLPPGPDAFLPGYH